MDVTTHCQYLGFRAVSDAGKIWKCLVFLNSTGCNWYGELNTIKHMVDTATVLIDKTRGTLHTGQMTCPIATPLKLNNSIIMCHGLWHPCPLIEKQICTRM